MAGYLRLRLDRDVIGEGEEISGSRGRGSLDAGEIVASADGSGTLKSIALLGDSTATASDNDNRGPDGGSTFWCKT